MSERTAKEVNEIIDKARGITRHGYRGDGSKDCVCGWQEVEVRFAMDVSGYGVMEHAKEVNNNYTDPTHYLEAMAWAKKQDWFNDFVQYELQGCCHKVIESIEEIGNEQIEFYVPSWILDPKEGSHALASYLEEKRNPQECTKCDGLKGLQACCYTAHT